MTGEDVVHYADKSFLTSYYIGLPMWTTVQYGSYKLPRTTQSLHMTICDRSGQEEAGEEKFSAKSQQNRQK